MHSQLTTTISFLFYLLLVQHAFANDEMAEKAYQQLGKNYFCIHPFKTDSRQIIEYTAVFSKDNHHRIAVAESNSPESYQLKVSILNQQKENIFTTDVKGKLLREFDFRVEETGIYYIKIEWLGEPVNGGVAIGWYHFLLEPHHEEYGVELRVTTNGDYQERNIFAQIDKESYLFLSFWYKEKEITHTVLVKGRSNEYVKKIVSEQLKESYPHLSVQVISIFKL